MSGACQMPQEITYARMRECPNDVKEPACIGVETKPTKYHQVCTPRAILNSKKTPVKGGSANVLAAFLF